MAGTKKPRTFGEWAKNHREENGYTLRFVSEGSHVSLSNLHRIERGNDTTLETAELLSRFYGHELHEALSQVKRK